MASFVVAGITRNCAETFLAEVSILNNALINHDVRRIVAVESDSDDNSENVLLNWSQQSDINTFFSLGHIAKKYPKRTERLAFCRNIYMNFLERYDFFGAEYLFVTDFDGVNTHLTSETINSVLSILDEQPSSAATANQLYKYFDIWALRHAVWSPDDCWDSFHKLSGLIGASAAHKVCNESRMIHLEPNQPVIEVDSAFGGGAIYPTSLLAKCRYDGLLGEREVCEHVSFSSDLRSNGGKLYVVPSFINHDVSEHVLNAEMFDEKHVSDSMVGNEQ